MGKGLSQMSIRVTSRRIFKRCRRKYFLSEIMRLEQILKPEYLRVGTLVHELLSNHYKGLDEANEYIINALDDINEDDKVIRYIYNEYIAKESRRNMVSVEQEYSRFVLSTETHYISLQGKPDAIEFNKKNNTYYLWEHKTASRPWDGDMGCFNDQVLTYCWLLEPVYKISEAIINVFVTKIPDVPEITKSGKVSKRKITTTYDIYYNTLLENGQANDPEYTEILNQLLAEPYEFRKQIIVPIEDWKVEQQGRYIREEIMDMIRCNTWDRAYPNLDEYLCKFCEFRELCREVHSAQEFLKAYNNLEVYGLKVKEASKKDEEE